MVDNPAPSAAQPLVAEIVSSYVRKNHVPPADIPTLITTVYQSLMSLGKVSEPAPPQAPAVPIHRSVSAKYVVCLECGMRRQTLRRHLRQAHELSADEYLAKWRLSPDHPLTAPEYTQRRSTMAKDQGLGQKRTPPRRRQRSQATA